MNHFGIFCIRSDSTTGNLFYFMNTSRLLILCIIKYTYCCFHFWLLPANTRFMLLSSGRKLIFFLLRELKSVEDSYNYWTTYRMRGVVEIKKMLVHPRIVLKNLYRNLHIRAPKYSQKYKKILINARILESTTPW